MFIHSRFEYRILFVIMRTLLTYTNISDYTITFSLILGFSKIRSCWSVAVFARATKNHSKLKDNLHGLSLWIDHGSTVELCEFLLFTVTKKLKFLPLANKIFASCSLGCFSLKLTHNNQLTISYTHLKLQQFSSQRNCSANVSTFVLWNWKAVYKSLSIGFNLYNTFTL